MQRVWETAMGTMVASTMNFSNATGDIFKNVASNFAAFVKTVIVGLELMALKEMWEAHITVAAEQSKAQARGVSSVFAAIPFPFNLIAAAAAFAAINAIFAKILKFEKGGIFKEPTIAEVGHGTEYVLPEKKLIDIVRGAMLPPAFMGAPAMAMAGAGGGGATFNNTIEIHTSGLSRRDLEMAAEDLTRIVDGQLRRVGRRL
jgi:hypothetical protein